MYNVTFYALRMAVVCSVCKYVHYLSSKCASSVHGPLLTIPSSSNRYTLNYCIRLGTERIFPKDEIDTHSARTTPGLC